MIRNILQFTLSVVAKIVLFSTGWIIDKNEFIENYSKENRAVLIYPHSTFFDFIIFCLYYYAYGLYDIYTIMSERFVPFECLAPSIIAAPDYMVRHYSDKGESRLKSIFYAWRDKFSGRKVPSEYKRAHFVDKLKQKMNTLHKFKILISPTGSVTDQNWKSGYYNLAKSLEVPIIVCGTDYCKRRLVCKKSDTIEEYTGKSSEELNEKFQDISCFHNSEDAYIFNTTSIISTFFFLLNYYKIYNKSLLLALVHTLGYFSGCLYYSNNFKTKNLSSICKAVTSMFLFVHNTDTIFASVMLLISNIFYNIMDIYVNTERYDKKNKFFYDVTELLMGVSIYNK